MKASGSTVIRKAIAWGWRGCLAVPPFTKVEGGPTQAAPPSRLWRCALAQGDGAHDRRRK